MSRELRSGVCLVVALTVGTGTAGAGSWSGLGPALAGRLSAIVASPGDPNRLLVASPGGGIWRTTDGGLSWHQPRSYALADFSVVHLEWDRIRSGRLYASTYSDLYASTDLADRWTNLTRSGGRPAPLMPSSHPADPKPFAQLRYSARESTVFWSRPCTGLFYSFDGTSFTQHWPFPGGAENEDNCIQAIAADELTGRVYFSTMARSGTAHLFRSSCAWTATAPCLSWESANTGLPSSAVVAGIAWAGAANRLAAAVSVSSSTQVFTTGNGSDWTAAATQPPASSWTPRPFIAVGSSQLLLGTVVAYQTTNWGGSWSDIFFSGMHPDVRAFHWGSYPGGGLLWATTDGSQSSGTYAAITRWSFTPGSAPTGGSSVGLAGLANWQPYFVAVTGRRTLAYRHRMFVGSLDNGILCSDDRGATWTTAGTPPGSGCGDYVSMAFAPNNPDRAYARTCSSTGFARSDNAASAASCAGVTWTTIEPMTQHYTPFLWTRAMSAVHPSNPDRVAFARSLEVGVSADGGANWTMRTLPGTARPVSVLIDGAGALYAGTVDLGVYRSADWGETWTPFGLNESPPKAVLKIAHSSAGGDAGTFFLATTDGLFRKLPAGTFTRQTPDSAYTVSDVEVDPGCPTRVYAALGYAGQFGQHRGGVLMSDDNGGAFDSLTSGLDIHQAPITDLEVDPLDNRYLHAAVFGLGAWTYDHGARPSCP